MAPPPPPPPPTSQMCWLNYYAQHDTGNTADTGTQSYADTLITSASTGLQYCMPGLCSHALPSHGQTHYSCNAGGSPLRRHTGSQPSNTAEGISSPRLGRSSSVGMGSGDSTTSGRGQPWHHVPRALHTNGQRITTRIPSWLHLTALGQHLHALFI